MSIQDDFKGNMQSIDYFLTRTIKLLLQECFKKVTPKDSPIRRLFNSDPSLVLNIYNVMLLVKKIDGEYI